MQLHYYRQEALALARSTMGAGVTGHHLSAGLGEHPSQAAATLEEHGFSARGLYAVGQMVAGLGSRIAQLARKGNGADLVSTLLTRDPPLQEGPANSTAMFVGLRARLPDPGRQQQRTLFAPTQVRGPPGLRLQQPRLGAGRRSR